jgi:hypothetical protein
VKVIVDFLTKTVARVLPVPDVVATAVNQIERPALIAVPLKFALMLLLASAAAIGLKLASISASAAGIISLLRERKFSTSQVTHIPDRKFSANFLLIEPKFSPVAPNA